jgi:hypothetical protein
MICQFYIESQKMTIIDNLHRPTRKEGNVRQARRLPLLHSTASHVVPVLTLFQLVFLVLYIQREEKIETSNVVIIFG